MFLRTKTLFWSKRKHEFRKSDDLVNSRQIDKIFSCQSLKTNEKDQRGFNKQSCFWKRFSSFRKEQKESPVAQFFKILSLVSDG